MFASNEAVSLVNFSIYPRVQEGSTFLSNMAAKESRDLVVTETKLEITIDRVINT